VLLDKIQEFSKETIATEMVSKNIKKLIKKIILEKNNKRKV